MFLVRERRKMMLRHWAPPEMVEAGGHQKYGAWEMDIVSKPFFKANNHSKYIFFLIFLAVTMTNSATKRDFGPQQQTPNPTQRNTPMVCRTLRPCPNKVSVMLPSSILH